MRGRPRTSAKILQLRGAFIKDPQRAREDLPGVGEFDPDPPPGLTGREIAAWKDLVAALPKIVLTGTDRAGVMQMARLWAALLETPPHSPDFVKLDSAFRQWCIQNAMTPLARMKFGTDVKAKAKSRFAALKE